MSIQQFIKIKVNQQLQMAVSDGIFLESFPGNDSTISLYYVYGFFVEVIYFDAKPGKYDIIPYTSGYSKKNYDLLRMSESK